MIVCVYRGKKCKPVYLQIAQQVVQLKAEDLRLPSRAWKVKLVGEGADDAGGVFDDTITEMCLVSSHLSVVLYAFVCVCVGGGDADCLCLFRFSVMLT